MRNVKDLLTEEQKLNETLEIVRESITSCSSIDDKRKYHNRMQGIFLHLL